MSTFVPHIDDNNMLLNIVLDTNCLVQMISRRSPYYGLWDSFLKGHYRLCVTTEIMEEYEEILTLKSSSYVAQLVCEIILRAPNTVKFDAHYKWNLITSDYDDNKFVDCAIVANANYIVSEDSHFKVLHTIPFPQVKVMRLDAFKKRLSLKL